MAALMTSPAPRVSIGVAVYNGENFLEGTLDSILGQTYTDLEVIISDNGSTDRSAAICEQYAKRDRRLRYHRNQANVGATRNHNLVFQMARGEYFKWNAHDDPCAPSFISRCVEALDRDPSAVLAYPRARIIDQHGDEIDPGDGYDPTATLGSPSVLGRLREAISSRHRTFPIFGLIRASALRRTPLFEGYSHSDRILMTRLALMGRFVQIPEPLLFSRVHPDASGQLFSNPRRLLAWWDPSKRGRILLPHWRVFFEYFSALNEANLGWRTATLGYLEVLASLRTRWWRRKLIDDLKRPLGQILAGLTARQRLRES
jgi:glycosyltransferase involved in cell wall biosynthesis